MKCNKLTMAIAVISIVMSVLSFLIIYNDMTAVPEYDKYFICLSGGIL